MAGFFSIDPNIPSMGIGLAGEVLISLGFKWVHILGDGKKENDYYCYIEKGCTVECCTMDGWGE